MKAFFYAETILLATLSLKYIDKKYQEFCSKLGTPYSKGSVKVACLSFTTLVLLGMWPWDSLLTYWDVSFPIYQIPIHVQPALEIYCEP